MVLSFEDGNSLIAIRSESIVRIIADPKDKTKSIIEHFRGDSIIESVSTESVTRTILKWQQADNFNLKHLKM